MSLWLRQLAYRDACRWTYCPQDHSRARQQRLSAVPKHVALVTCYSQKKHGLKRGPDLTSHNELLVNGISGGAPFWIVGTVNINTQAWFSHSWMREYPIEKWPTKNKKALQHQKCNLFTLWLSVGVVSMWQSSRRVTGLERGEADIF